MYQFIKWIFNRSLLKQTPLLKLLLKLKTLHKKTIIRRVLIQIFRFPGEVGDFSVLSTAFVDTEAIEASKSIADITVSG